MNTVENIDNKKVATGSVDDGSVTKEVVTALWAGDVKAFDIVYLTYKKHIHHFISRLTGSPEAAEEITNDIFTHLWQNRQNVKPEFGVKSLLFAMARNKAIDYLRTKRSMGEFFSQCEELPEYFASAADETIIERETRLLLEIALTNMPEQRRTVYRMRLSGLTNRQIAEKLDLTADNVRQHLSRAYKDLASLRSLILFFMLAQ